MEYLLNHGISLSEIFDCHGKPVGRYKSVMKKLGKTIAVNATPCYAHGHTIRTRSNHCFQCSTRNYGFLKQHISGGWVYIASSRAEGLLKIGLTVHPVEREGQLNSAGYGGASDWVIQYCLHAESNAGELECRVHGVLSDWPNNA